MADINPLIEKIDALKEQHIFLLGVVKRQSTKIFMYQMLCGVLLFGLLGTAILYCFK